jgi:hypothetical protein
LVDRDEPQFLLNCRLSVDRGALLLLLSSYFAREGCPAGFLFLLIANCLHLFSSFLLCILFYANVRLF